MRSRKNYADEKDLTLEKIPDILPDDKKLSFVVFKSQNLIKMSKIHLLFKRDNSDKNILSISSDEKIDKLDFAVVEIKK